MLPLREEEGHFPCLDSLEPGLIRKLCSLCVLGSTSNKFSRQASKSNREVKYTMYRPAMPFFVSKKLRLVDFDMSRARAGAGAGDSAAGVLLEAKTLMWR